MKTIRTLLTLSLAVLTTLACTKPGGNSNANTPDDTPSTIQNILLPDAEASETNPGHFLATAILGSGESTFMIQSDPEGFSVLNDMAVELVSGEENIDHWSVSPAGILLEPKQLGSASFRIRALSGPASPAYLDLNFVNKIKSLAITSKTLDPFYKSNKLHVSMGIPVKLTLRVTDVENLVVAGPRVIYTVSGEGVQVSGAGVVTATQPSKVATIRAASASDESIYDEITVQTYAQPTGITISGEKESYIARKTEKLSLTLRVEPSNAYQEITVTSPNSDATLSQSRLSGGSVLNPFYLELKVGAGQYHVTDPLTVEIQDAHKTVSKTVSVYFTEFFAEDVKVGDYIYFNSKSNTYRSSDCGRRANSLYEGGASKIPSPQENEYYLGVLVKILSASDMAANGGNFLYENGTGSVSKGLPGLSNSPSTHGIVLAKDEYEGIWCSSTSKKYRTDAWPVEPYGYTTSYNLYSALYKYNRYSNSALSKVYNYMSSLSAVYSTGWFMGRTSCWPNDLGTIRLSFKNTKTTDIYSKSSSYKDYWTPWEYSEKLADVCTISWTSEYSWTLEKNGAREKTDTKYIRPFLIF